MKLNHEHVLENRSRLIATVDLPDDYWFCGLKEQHYQSLKRPFTLSFLCTQHQDMTGNWIHADTGEAFIHKRMPMTNPLTGQRIDPAEGDFDRVHGTVIKTFLSVEGYLDDEALRVLDGMPARLLLNEYLGQTAQQVEQQEIKATHALQKSCEEMGGSFMRWVAHRALSRTQVRYYACADHLGQKGYLAVGARMRGADLVGYKTATGITTMRDRSNPFGHAPLDFAIANDVEWESTLRFASMFNQSDIGFDEFRAMIEGVVRNIRFSDELMDEMRAETSRLWKEQKERLDKEHAAHRRRMDELRAQSAQQDAERARREQERAAQRAAQRAADQARRDSWNRKMESDRRRRQAVSDAIRGVDRYEHPYDGGTIEVRTGYGQRAFYNSADDRVITSDTDLDRPFGYEELKRKEP